MRGNRLPLPDLDFLAGGQGGRAALEAAAMRLMADSLAAPVTVRTAFEAQEDEMSSCLLEGSSLIGA